MISRTPETWRRHHRVVGLTARQTRRKVYHVGFSQHFGECILRQVLADNAGIADIIQHGGSIAHGMQDTRRKGRFSAGIGSRWIHLILEGPKLQTIECLKDRHAAFSGRQRHTIICSWSRDRSRRSVFSQGNSDGGGGR